MDDFITGTVDDFHSLGLFVGNWESINVLLGCDWCLRVIGRLTM